jgi:parvulin-like peptidyl-prolyl isomerase
MRRDLHPAAAALALACVGSLLSGCFLFREVGLSENEPDPEAVKPPANERKEPSHVVVRHVLIAFDKTNVASVTRTREEAERLAQKVFEMAKSGRDFAELVRLYSDDRHGPGTYSLANWGVTPAPGEGERDRMVRGFGRVAFSLDVGQIGLLPYDSADSPFGWHVIRREK